MQLKKYTEESELGVAHLWWREMHKEIKIVLKYRDKFPENLLPRLPPIYMGYEYKIDLEYERPSTLDRLQAKSTRVRGSAVIEVLLENCFI